MLHQSHATTYYNHAKIFHPFRLEQSVVMPRGSKRKASNPATSGSRKKSKTVSGVPTPCSTLAGTRIQDGGAAEPLTRGDIPRLGAGGSQHPGYTREWPSVDC